MPNNKELFEQKMDALANSINTKANTSGAKTIDQLKTAVDGIVTGGYTISANTYGDTIDILGSAIYSITASITNGTASGATTILPNGTAYITDIGMTGPLNGVIGVKKEIILDRYINNGQMHFEPEDEGVSQFSAIIVTVDDKTHKATKIERLYYLD